MNLNNQIKQVLRKAQVLKQWALNTFKSLELEKRAIQILNLTQVVIKKTFAWIIKTARYLVKLVIKICRKTREAIILFIAYLARKKFIFEQWSIKHLKPRWHKLKQRSRELLLAFTRAVFRITKNIIHDLWLFTKYSLKQLRIFSIATAAATKYFLARTWIFIKYCSHKARHYAKLFYLDLIKDCRYSWRIFIRLLKLLYKHSKITARLINVALRRAATFLTLCLKKSWVFFKYSLTLAEKYSLIILRLIKKGLVHTGIFLILCLMNFWIILKHTLALSGKYSLVTLRFIDRELKRTGVLLTLGLKKLWRILILFGQGLMIIANNLWHLFIRTCIGLFKFTLIALKAVDTGFKQTGFLLTYFLIKTWQFFVLFIRLLAKAINRVIETILIIIVQSVHTIIVFTWRTVKFLLWSPVILFNFILPKAVTHHLKQYALLIRLNKPIGILLLLWPTLIALWLAAKGWPDLNVLLVFIAGVFLMRSAGCAINDYADRDIDPQVKRTKDRPLASGALSVIEALVIFASLSVMAFMLVLQLNGLTITMSFIGLALAASYPFMKRYHYLPQVHLGAAFGWAVPMAFAAQANELAPVAWLLFFATVLWATAYDTMYAMVDREDDILIGAKSTAILFEDADTLIIGIIQSILIICLIMIGVKAELGGLYFLSVLVATGFAAWQQFLIKDRKPAQCFEAFMNNNWFGFILFAGVFLEYQIGSITS